MSEPREAERLSVVYEVASSELAVTAFESIKAAGALCSLLWLTSRQDVSSKMAVQGST